MNEEQQIIEPVPTLAGYKKIPTFKLWIANQFPYIETDFDAITNYELLQAVIKYLNTIIENENNVESNVTALYNAFVNLHDYVENFFDNLDVQEEINNKLDKMVEDGTLESILLNYTQITKTFDTYNDMMLDTSTYVNGMKLKTLGYHYINDGGGAEYVVTNAQSDTKYQVSIGTNLWIEMIINDSVNIIQGGAKSNDNSFDNSTIINTLLTKYKKVIIPNGTFYCSNIIINSGNELIGDNRLNSILKCNSNDSKMIICNNTGTRNGVIKNLTINGDNKANYGLYLEYYTHSSIIENVTINNCKVGCYIDQCWYAQFINLDINNNDRGLELYANNNEINAIQFINCYIDYATTDYGIYIHSTSHILNCIKFNSCTIEHTESKGLFIDVSSNELLRNLEINNCYFEQNKDNCIDGNGRELTIQNCYFHPYNTSQRIINSQFNSLFVNNCFEEADVIPEYSIYHTGNYLFCNSYYFNATNKLYTTDNCVCYNNSPYEQFNNNLSLVNPKIRKNTGYNTPADNSLIFGINDNAVDNNAPYEYKIKYDYSNAYFGIPLKISSKYKGGSEIDALTISGRSTPKLKINNTTSFEIPKGTTKPTDNLSSGCLFYDTTSNKLCYYNGTSWIEL